MKNVSSANHVITTTVMVQRGIDSPVSAASKRHATGTVIPMSTKDRCRCLSMKYAALEDNQAVIATPERVLNGHPVGPRTGTAVCISCGVPLYETDIVFAYAYRRAESVQWVVARLFCHSCVSATIRTDVRDDRSPRRWPAGNDCTGNTTQPPALSDRTSSLRSQSSE